MSDKIKDKLLAVVFHIIIFCGYALMWLMYLGIPIWIIYLFIQGSYVFAIELLFIYVFSIVLGKNFY